VGGRTGVARARFEREVRTLARLDHRNIVQVYDAGVWRGQPFLTMQFVRGRTLAHQLPQLRTDLPAACRVLARVARAVAYLHSEGVVHRDLKPLNVLIADDGAPLVADFGLARSARDTAEVTATGQPVGTQPYMSPEQTAGGREGAQPACDIWALGVILYELLAGDRPFEHDDRGALFKLIRCAPTPPIAAHMLAPPELEGIARRCLAKNPADRYPSASELADHLEAWAQGEPVVLPPEPPAPVERAARAPARRAALWARAAALACAVAVLASGGGPAPSAPPTANERLDRGETLVLLDATGDAQFPVEPTLPGSALHRHELGFAVMSGGTHQVVRFKTGPLKFPLEVSADVMHWNPKDLPNHGGLALGQQRVSYGGAPHELVWTFGVTGGARELVGDRVRLTDRTYGQLLLVSHFDKRHYSAPTFLRPFVELDGEVPAPLGAGVGLFTFGGDTAFRNATIRRPR
jgi:eukaryotic-like serine/threonine-protein kinase